MWMSDILPRVCIFVGGVKIAKNCAELVLTSRRDSALRSALYSMLTSAAPPPPEDRYTYLEVLATVCELLMLTFHSLFWPSLEVNVCTSSALLRTTSVDLAGYRVQPSSRTGSCAYCRRNVVRNWRRRSPSWRSIYIPTQRRRGQTTSHPLHSSTIIYFCFTSGFCTFCIATPPNPTGTLIWNVR